MRRTPLRMIAVAVLITATVVTVTLAARGLGRRIRTLHPSTAVVTVEGLTCDVCVQRLEDRMAKVPGVKSATVDLARQAAGLTFQPGATISQADIDAAVRDAGFQPTSVKWEKDLNALPVLAQLVMHGKQHPACADNVKRRLQRERGVRSAVVDVEKDETSVVYDPQGTTVTNLMKALRDAQDASDKD